ncbi:MAG: hypothetical protein QXS41_00945 [Candidatus Woesearchaeota archaeon]
MVDLYNELLEKIENTNAYDLIEFKRRLKENFEELIKLIDSKIEKFEESNKFCAVCGSPISEIDEPFVLLFGKRGIRKKAYFCGSDCLNYFLNNYNNLKRGNQSLVSKKLYF